MIRNEVIQAPVLGSQVFLVVSPLSVSIFESLKRDAKALEWSSMDSTKVGCLDPVVGRNDGQ